MKRFIFVLMVISLVGCASQMLRTGKKYAPLKLAAKVTVFIDKKPSVGYEEIGVIVSNSSDPYNLSIYKAKVQARKMGGNGLISLKGEWTLRFVVIRYIPPKETQSFF